MWKIGFLFLSLSQPRISALPLKVKTANQHSGIQSKKYSATMVERLMAIISSLMKSNHPGLKIYFQKANALLFIFKIMKHLHNIF